MSNWSVCLHGHEVALRGDQRASSTVVCPVCGSVTDLPDFTDRTTDGGEFAQTVIREKPDSPTSIATKDQPGNEPGKVAPGGLLSVTGDYRAAGTDVSDSSTGISGATQDAPTIDRIPGSDPTGPAASRGLSSSKVNNPYQGTIVWHSGGDQPAAEATEIVEPPQLPGFTVLEELGRGGMGVVYRAHEERRGTDVALKTLQRMSPTDLQRFKQEFRALADIAHPNLASLHELLSDGQTWCFSMDVLEGVEFLEYVWSGLDGRAGDAAQSIDSSTSETEARLTADRLQRLRGAMTQLAQGLHVLHEKGLLHRDIKPSNVMVTTDDRLVLLDFGLAAGVRDETADGTIQGTPAYMSPEQASGLSVTPASDWYSVGVMLYEVLTGLLPIRGRTIEILLQKQQVDPRPPIEVEPGIPEELNRLCLQLLDRDPARRPDSAAVLEALGAGDLAATLRSPQIDSTTQAVELVGRDQHLARLQQAWEDVRQGQTRSVFVHGRSGMGKSVLIRTLIDRISEGRDAYVLEGRCYEQESVPFKALDSLIDSLAVFLGRRSRSEVEELMPQDTLALTRLFPVLGQFQGAVTDSVASLENADQQEVRQRALTALRELLSRMSRARPVVLYVDDLQWGDEASAGLLADLVRPPESPRLLLLGSYRSENVDTSVCLRELARAYEKGDPPPPREEIAVESLNREDSRRLALMLLNSDDETAGRLADRIAQESGGWPFFVWELAQHAQEDSSVADQNLELDEVIWTRVNRLPEDTRRLLELFAVAARPMSAHEAFQAANQVTQGPGLLAQLRTSNFVRTTETEDVEQTVVETYHDRIRESVVDHLDDAVIRSHNLNLALTIERASELVVAGLRAHIAATPEFEESRKPFTLEKHQRQRVFDLASFFEAAGEHDRAFPYALVAAETARKQNALEVAEQQFRIAMRGLPTDSVAIRFRVLEGLASVLMLRGQYEEARSRFEQARSLTEQPLAVARIEGKLGALAFKQGDMAPAGEYLEQALNVLGERPPRNLATLLFGLCKEATIQLIHTFLPSTTGRRDAESLEGQKDLFRARLYDEFTIVCWYARGMELCLWSHLRQMNLAERYPPSGEMAKVYSFHSIVMSGLPMPQRAKKYSQRSYNIWKDRGDLWGQGQSKSFATFSYYILGEHETANETSSLGVELLEQAGDVWEGNMARMMNTWALYHIGDMRGAYRQVQRVVATGREVGDYSALAIGLCFWMQIHPESAPEGAMQAEADRPREDPLSSALAIQGRGLEILFREDNPQEAARVLQDSLDLAKSKGIRNVCVFAGATWKVTALRIAAERERDPVAQSRIIREARKAARTAKRITKSYQTCRAHLLREAGILETLAGREKHAVRYLDDSIAVATRQKARRELAKSQLARAEAGVKFGWPGAHDDLTRTQSLVAEIEDLTTGS